MSIPSNYSTTNIYDSMRQRDLYYKNGLLNENKVHLIKRIAETVKNNKGTSFKLNSDQCIEVYEEAIEI
jgi:hypothetical protein